jgi:6,7-dimethyl-8-ribityllumazine synthase
MGYTSMREKDKMTEEIRIGIVVSEFNYDITMMMLERAREHAEFLGARVVKVIKVPGVFDMGLAIKKLLQSMNIDGVVALGAVIEGETEHDEIVIQHASRKIADLALEYDKPVGLGITGPGMSRLQAEERIERAKMAVESVIKLHKALEDGTP